MLSWKLEIYRAFFVAFGMFEIITNIRYLYLKDGIELAVKQHGELPKGILEKQVKLKVIFMLFFGVLFFIIGGYSYLIHSVNKLHYLGVLIIFAIYAFGEALYYRFWKTFGFSIVSFLFLLGFII